ncbi:MAG TPA: DUF1003 domain-containing protein [Candidatus Binatia bacterium]|nr:DUF1003 domain-containing protein [Candidatus Binatia bacterium]
MNETDSYPAQQNVRTVSQLEQAALRSRSVAERVSDVLTKAVGSLSSIVLHLTWFTLWILINTGVLPIVQRFDPFPFGILTLIVSTEGVLLALTILISQNRMIRQADRRAHLDLQISLLDEQETTAVLRILRRMAQHLGVPDGPAEAEVSKLSQQTDIDVVMRNLEEQLPKD